MLIALLLAAATSPFHAHGKSSVLTFDHRWPAQASALPGLRRQLVAQMKHDRARYAKMAEADRVQRADQKFPFFPYSVSRSLHFGGQTPRLTSFADERYTFTGGAHGNPSTRPLLWDRRLGKTVRFADLFSQSPTAILRPGYCKALADQRRKKLGTDNVADVWDRCPDPLSLAVIPEDKNRNGRFETINVTASPYDVGSYAEGYYIVQLPVSPALLTRLKPQYRAGFEAQRQ